MPPPTGTTAVLLTVWRRPNETEAVLRALEQLGPIDLFVAGDGPRSSAESIQVQEVRALVERARTWNPNIRTSFSDKNLGCKAGMERAINWFFDNVTEGVILEDDCVPHPDFLRFAREALEQYRGNTRVMHVSGDRSMPVSIVQDWSYCFVRYPHSWGWATWRRAWRHYESDMASWKAIVDASQESHVFPDEDERAVWVPIFNRLAFEDEPDSWAWRWAASCIVRDGLTVQPLTNLVTNIGFGATATHTKKPGPRSSVAGHAILPLNHPPTIYRHLAAERQIFEHSQRRRKKVPAHEWLLGIRGVYCGLLSRLPWSSVRDTGKSGV